MENEVKGMAHHFVMLLVTWVDQKGDGYIWEKIGYIGPEALRSLLLMAGFEASAVVPGVIKVPEYDQGGSYTGQTFTVNPFCHYKILDSKGGDHRWATGWLNALAERAWPKKLQDLRQSPEGNEAERWIEAEILRSRPLEPICLGEDDFLLEVPPLSHVGIRPNYMPDHTRDEHILPRDGVGLHKGCGGTIDRKPFTDRYHLLQCRKCSLRVKLAISVKTYGELRQALVPARESGTD
jgi:hypothetical protein